MTASVIDLSGRGRIKVTGEDRARLLHAMTTNHVQQMQPGDVVYAFFLDAQGRILADAHLLCFEDHFLLDVAPASRAFLLEHLDHYIIADDVELEDVTASTWCLGVEGDGVEPPADAVQISYTGEPGYRLYGSGPLPELGLPPMSLEEADALRIANRKPAFGVDFGDKSIPQETQLMHAVHFQKGCYIGQEIVERVRARGHLNKLLMAFEIAAPVTVAAGEKVFHEGKETGEITSSVIHAGKTFGFGVIRVPAAAVGAVVEVAGHSATLAAPK